MKKRMLFSISGIVVLVAIGFFVFSQIVNNQYVRAESSCGQTESVMSAATVSSDCCSSAADVNQVKMTEVNGVDCGTSTTVAATSVECPAVIQAAASAGCTGVQQTVSASCCSGVTNAAESAGCSGTKETEVRSSEMIQVMNTSETSCCEGSAEKALLADACCGNCI